MNKFKKALLGEQKNIYTFAIVDTSQWYDCSPQGVDKYNQRLLSFEKELRSQSLVFSKSTVDLSTAKFFRIPYMSVAQYLIANIPFYYLCHLFDKKEFCVNYFIFGEVNGKSKFKKPRFYSFLKKRGFYLPSKDKWYCHSVKISNIERCQEFLKKKGEEKFFAFASFPKESIIGNLNELSNKIYEKYSPEESYLLYKRYLKFKEF